MTFDYQYLNNGVQQFQYEGDTSDARDRYFLKTIKSRGDSVAFEYGSMMMNYGGDTDWNREDANPSDEVSGDSTTNFRKVGPVTDDRPLTSKPLGSHM